VALANGRAAAMSHRLSRLVAKVVWLASIEFDGRIVVVAWTPKLVMATCWASCPPGRLSSFLETRARACEM
jgi:hypothetical protein